jgi:hypothetical protein
LPETELTLLSKPDCTLCHEMRAVVERVLAGGAVRLLERDIREDPKLERRYRFEIPVLLWGDREVVRHRVTEPELRSRLLELGFPRV